MLIKDQTGILNQWAEHFCLKALSTISDEAIDYTFFKDPSMNELDEAPTESVKKEGM